MRNLILLTLLATLVSMQESPSGARSPASGVGVVVETNNRVDSSEDDLSNTELLLSFTTFRHGDRTPDDEELDFLPAFAQQRKSDVFFPYGTKALTNKGKQRGFHLGKYLRKRYDGFLSRLYLPDEVSVRTTDYSRTKMTALTAMAALYPPQPAQRWNPSLDWQPVPYNTLPHDTDDLLYWYNCPRYLWIRNNQVYNSPEVKKRLKPYESLFEYLTTYSGVNITTTSDVFYLDNLFQTLANVGIQAPSWAQEVMPHIIEITKIEYATEFYNDELIRLAAGVQMSEILNATTAAMNGDLDQPKMRIYSAHENNVAAAMAAARVFEPHQPKYGSTFSLEFRRNRITGQYGYVAVYQAEVGQPEKVLRIAGCGDRAFCSYDTFLTLTQGVIWSREEFRRQCPTVS